MRHLTGPDIPKGEALGHDVARSGFLIRQYLLFFILPLWIAAGVTDYVLHRRTHIEDTSGTKESLLHALQLGEAGIPVLMGSYC